MNEAENPGELTVRELMAFLSDCDPSAPVDLLLPTWFRECDRDVADEPYASAIQEGYRPETAAAYSKHADEGAKPNRVSIGLSDADLDEMLRARRAQIQDAQRAADQAEREPLQSDDQHVVLDFKISRDDYESIRTLVRRFNAANSRSGANTGLNGLLTVVGVLEMLAEDLAMAETRPGSWEGANMLQLLSSHGYSS